MAAMNSWTKRVPRRMAWRVMMPTKISMFSQEQLTGVKCKVIRLFSVS